MAKREIEEINAGSMADIAFLLLIFFLITTTMNFPKALEERLPQKSNTPPSVKKERNVLDILANRNGAIFMEGAPAEISDIVQAVKDFYVHDDNDLKWPVMMEVTEEDAKNKVNQFEEALKKNPDNQTYKDELAQWEIRYETVKLVGPYKELDPKATVSITLDNATRFEVYLSVLNEVLRGLNELRDELCQKKFGKSYYKLNDRNPDDKAIILALRQVYSKRINRAKSRSTTN